MSLPYVGKEGLPSLPEEINLEYFEKALNWLKAQPEVDQTKIILMGASRNAELSLIIAATFPVLVSGVIAYAPSSVSWSNTVLSYNSIDIKASWKYNGQDIPYVPMDRLSGGNSDTIETLNYWKNGLAKADYVSKAHIKVENINGPVLLFSGINDKVWPSAFMADMLEERIEQSDYKFSFQNIKYENSGHLISGHPEIQSDIRTGILKISGKSYEFEQGGTSSGDSIAKQDAKIRLLDLLEKI